MRDLEIGWFQPWRVTLEDADDYGANYVEIWEQLEYEYEVSLTYRTRLRRWGWRFVSGFLDEVRRFVLVPLEP